MDATQSATASENPQNMAATSEIPVRGVSFPVLQANPGTPQSASLNRFLDVTVTVTVELGRIAIPIGDLLQLGPGSVVELDRTVSEPADVMAQGVRLGRGEIVVVDDRYAVRMLEIEAEHGADSTGGPKQSPMVTTPEKAESSTQG